MHYVYLSNMTTVDVYEEVSNQQLREGARCIPVRGPAPCARTRCPSERWQAAVQALHAPCPAPPHPRSPTTPHNRRCML